MIQPSTQIPEARGAVPQAQAMGGGQTPKLPPEQMDALRQDPEIQQAVFKYLGKKVDMAAIPDEIISEIAGMVHKLGVDGAVAEFSQKIPPQIQAQIKARMGAK